MTNNPTNSTLIEALLEICRSDATAEVKNSAEQLRRLLTKTPTLVKKIDDTVSAKGYKDTSINFGRQYRGIDTSLSGDAMKVFYVMTQMCLQSQLVQLPIKLIVEDLKISKPTLIKTIKELRHADYIREHTPCNTRNGVPTTYMVNPEIFTCCKPSHRRRLIEEYVKLRGFSTDFGTIDYEIVKSKQSDGRVIAVSRYKGLADKEKELDSAKSNSDKDVSRLNSSSSSSSISQIDILFQEISGEVGVS